MGIRLARALFVSGTLLVAGTQLAWGANITIPDRVGTGTGWYRAGGGSDNGENDEVEPGCIIGQAWDLESFDLTGTTLRLTGGWNFRNGYGGFASGDIFIDVVGVGTPAVWGEQILGNNGNYAPLPNPGYDYVIHFTRNGQNGIEARYDVYEINGQTRVLAPFYEQNDESSPYVWLEGGRLLDLQDTTALFGPLGEHNTMDVDVGFLGAGTEAIFKFTMGCGNDNLVGQGRIPVPDGGLTAMLLGLGLIGMAALKRRLLS